MKVTFCAYDRPNYVGGPNAGLIRLLPALRERGVQASCLFLRFAPHGECPTIRELEARGVPCVSTPYHSTTELRVRWLLARLRLDPPDVFVPNLMPAAYFAARWCREAGIPSVGVLRNVDAFHEGFLEEFAAGDPRFRQTAFVGVSAQAVEMIRAATDGRAGFAAVEQIPSPVEMQPQSVRYEGGELRLLYSGRMVERQKRVGLTARAMCRLVAQVPEVRCAMYGDGRDMEAVRAVVAENGAEAAVELPGRVCSEAMRGELSRHHAIALFSEYEGLPLALMEAMAAGLVPIGQRGNPGIEELVEHERTGLLLDDPEAELPGAVARLKNEPGLFARLSENAREHVRAVSSLEVVADKWCALFERIKNAEGPRRAVHMPLRLDLPPRNPKVASEDDRAAWPGRALALAQSFRPSFAHGEDAPFLAPRCLPSRVDTYTVRRALLRAVTDNLPLFRGLVADVGAGRAPYRPLILSAPGVTRHVSVDLEGGLYTQPDLTWDGKRLPFDDASVGTVLATEVLEHCPEPSRVLDESFRVLVPGGACVLTVPFLWPLHDVPDDQFRYTPWSLGRMLGQSGFTDVTITALGGYEAALAQMLGLYVRRRSRGAFYIRFVRPLFSVFAATPVWLLTALDKPEPAFREGGMVTGLCAVAVKPGGTA